MLDARVFRSPRTFIHRRRAGYEVDSSSPNWRANYTSGSVTTATRKETSSTRIEFNHLSSISTCQVVKTLTFFGKNVFVESANGQTRNTLTSRSTVSKRTAGVLRIRFLTSNLSFSFSTRFLLQVITIRLLMDHIEQRLRGEPARPMAADCPICVRGLLLANLNGLLAARRSRGLRHELGMATLLKRDKPKDRLVPINSRTSRIDSTNR